MKTYVGCVFTIDGMAFIPASAGVAARDHRYYKMVVKAHRAEAAQDFMKAAIKRQERNSDMDFKIYNTRILTGRRNGVTGMIT